MLGNVVKLGRAPTRSQIFEDLTLPALPDELLAAERSHAEVAAELATVREDFDRLNMGFDDWNLCRVDGTPFPIDGRNGLLVHLHRQRGKLEAAEQAARRNVADRRRAFGDEISRRIEPAGDALCALVGEHLVEAESMLELFRKLVADANKVGVGIRHANLSRASYLAHELAGIRAVLTPDGRGGPR